MYLMIIILNRVYFFLIKVKNQSPLFGASGIVMLLIYATFNNFLLFIYAFKSVPLIIKNYFDLIEMGLIFLTVYYFAKKNKEKIIEHSMFSNFRNNLFVVVLYAFTVISFVFLANINRDKIFKIEKKSHIQTPKKTSLEGQIKKWFNE